MAIDGGAQSEENQDLLRDFNRWGPNVKTWEGMKSQCDCLKVCLALGFKFSPVFKMLSTSIKPYETSKAPSLVEGEKELFHTSLLVNDPPDTFEKPGSRRNSHQLKPFRPYDDELRSRRQDFSYLGSDSPLLWNISEKLQVKKVFESASIGNSGSCIFENALLRFGKVLQSFGSILNPGLLTVLALSSLVVPTAAMETSDNVAVLYRPHTYAVRIGIGACIGIGMIVCGRIGGAVKTLLGPIMGTSSVLFLMLRNDSAIRPEIAWIVFGVWSSATLSYLYAQCNRITHANIYILTTAIVSGIFMGIIATIQKASMQTGLVTAIPPCVSFSAFASAFPFNGRQEISGAIV